jgi:hypothetical protein
MLQIYGSLETLSPLKSVMHQKKLLLEMIELQYDSILHSSFNQEAVITFDSSLPVSQFSQLHKLA